MAAASGQILVVGGGPAGAVTAYWLGRAGFHVTVIERAAARFANGQGIDITGPAVEVVRRMGLENEIRANTTGEAGFAILNDDAEPVGVVGTAGEASSADNGSRTLSLTKEIEIMRGTLSRILAGAAESLPHVTYKYGCSVSEIRQSETGVTAVLSDTGKADTYAAVIGADGLNSKVRRLAFDPDTNSKCLRPLDQYGAFFSMPGQEEDVPNARWQHFTRGRSAIVRPIDQTPTKSSGIVVLNGKSKVLEDVVDGSREDQKRTMSAEFVGLPGLGPRVIQQMNDADDFYFTRIAQIKLDRWHNGRVALVGDAAYAPSPNTGAGTLLAIVGGYLLAGELARSPDEPAMAFERYHALLKDFVAKKQVLPLSGQAPKLLNPQTAWGIWILRTIFWFVAWSGVWKYASISPQATIDLPEYTFSA
ncbi:related to 2-polyprenyl-6-methoxyphenol hydroxylase and related FAD-dependent oxidoreductases [Lecanosticta acicola]|uniref:Related to 2-polyprenyl-6-methoxyphenol hydroxylase and related FAD-dependent oxidoreductases n=1 Tax=Lecanosticta acicola TaxID=111012 RepID=A0AAI8Z7G3_9PEZI|nr:related to 2-polyprenyl-6-methoxyphenol hydroxylase and related FAD-dependent oxidoreductases [Lecanosticta acicola]